MGSDYLSTDRKYNEKRVVLLRFRSHKTVYLTIFGNLFCCRTVVIPLLFILPFLLSCDESGIGDPLKWKGIALYTGSGTWDESVTALDAALTSYDYQMERIGLDLVLNGGLHGHPILVVPGGDPVEISQTLGAVGRSKIEQFVASGGGYIGCGGGATVAGFSSDERVIGIGLFNGETRWSLDQISPYPNHTLTDIRLVNPFHYIGNEGDGQVDYYSTLYRWGPEFIPLQDSEVDVIYHYEVTDSPACIAFTYRMGKVVLFGFQPEFEEGDDRDSTTFADDLNDSDSEWGILLRAVEYSVLQ